MIRSRYFQLTLNSTNFKKAKAKAKKIVAITKKNRKKNTKITPKPLHMFVS